MTLQDIQQQARQTLAERTRRAQQLEAAQVFVQQARAARAPSYYQWSAARSLSWADELREYRAAKRGRP